MYFDYTKHASMRRMFGILGKYTFRVVRAFQQAGETATVQMSHAYEHKKGTNKVKPLFLLETILTLKKRFSRHTKCIHLLANKTSLPVLAIDIPRSPGRVTMVLL